MKVSVFAVDVGYGNTKSAFRMGSDIATQMFPSLAPTVALYTTMTRSRGADRPLLFAGAYLVVWGAAGLVAYGLFELGRHAFGNACELITIRATVVAGFNAEAWLCWQPLPTPYFA